MGRPNSHWQQYTDIARDQKQYNQEEAKGNVDDDVPYNLQQFQEGVRHQEEARWSSNVCRRPFYSKYTWAINHPLHEASKSSFFQPYIIFRHKTKSGKSLGISIKHQGWPLYILPVIRIVPSNNVVVLPSILILTTTSAFGLKSAILDGCSLNFGINENRTNFQRKWQRT